MSSLALRKSLLIAESELNRVKLADDLLAVGGCVAALTDRAMSYSSIASSVVGLMAGLAAVTAPKPVAKRNWLQSVVSGASLLTSLWGAFRPR